jgi:four helix bundle protein
MTPEELKKRTQQFALRVMSLVSALPERACGRVLGNQLLRAGTAVGANYRAACRARSRAEFVAKLGVVIEEADESLYWLELIVEGKLMKHELVAELLREADELTAIMIASRKSAQKNASPFE